MSSSRRGTGVTRRVKKGFQPSSVRSEVKKVLAETVERKHLPTYEDAAAIPNAGELTQKNVLAQGTTVLTRIGNKVTYESFVVRMSAYLQNNTIQDTQRSETTLRVIFLLWKPNSTPTIGNILHDTTNQDRLVISPFNKEYRSQFIILYDSGATTLISSLWNGAQVNGNFAVSPVPRINFPMIVKPLTSFSAVYDGASSTDSSNRIYMLKLQNSGVQNRIDIESYCTLNFTDA